MKGMLEQASVEEMFQKYGEMLYKICIVMLENTYDAEDTVQDVLIKYMTKKPLFETYEHEKAWLIRVTINLCKDKLRFYKPVSYTHLDVYKRQERQLRQCVRTFLRNVTAVIFHVRRNCLKSRKKERRECVRLET